MAFHAYQWAFNSHVVGHFNGSFLNGFPPSTLFYFPVFACAFSIPSFMLVLRSSSMTSSSVKIFGLPSSAQVHLPISFVLPISP